MAIVELIMPKMGESIIEATIINWLKNEGDSVAADETVLEIATDKVDSEIPSPVSGVIKKILHHSEEVVAVGATLALIDSEEGGQEEKILEVHEANSIPDQKEKSSPGADVSERTVPLEHIPNVNKVKTPIPLTRRSLTTQIPSHVDGRFYSPLVRNIARAEGITVSELNKLNGSGADGRVTKFDILNYIDLLKLEASSSLKRAQTTSYKSISQDTEFSAPKLSEPSVDVKEDKVTSQTVSDEVIEVSRMRKVIAEHMKHSIDTAAHVTSFIEADATRLVNWRNHAKEEYKSKFGQKLTFSPIFAEIVIKALIDFPGINATFDGTKIYIKKSINIGIATAMENGNLIVPVIKNAGELNLLGLTKKLNDLTTRARVNQLSPDEIQGGTFTVSNIGTFGNIMGTPIIPQPQLAVLALGAIQKKPVIRETSEGDIIAIRHMMFLSLSFDHRVIDGYQGGIFLNRIGHYIETFDVNRPL